eukprot:1220157-Prymnesium_polylepis.1
MTAPTSTSMLSLVATTGAAEVRASQREGASLLLCPLADANGQPRCATANFRCSGCRAWAAHATDCAGGPSAMKMGDNQSRLSEP